MTASTTQSAPASAATATKRWYHRKFTTAAAVIDFVNAHPAQGAGEFAVTSHDDGTVDVFYYSTLE